VLSIDGVEIKQLVKQQEKQAQDFDVLWRYSDLHERRIVSNWATLSRWIRTQGFPPGRKLGPNTRVWFPAEVLAWVASRGVV
jgi:hypothetical protein